MDRGQAAEGLVERARRGEQEAWAALYTSVYARLVSFAHRRLGNAELQVFLYEDTSALAADMARLDTATVSPPGSPVAWPGKATLIRNANLAAILLSENALQIERVQRAIMAGTGSTVFGPR